MTFPEMIEAAKRAAGGQNALGRMVGGSHNIVRQWMSGMSLPSTSAQEAALGKLVGLSPEDVHEIVWLERRQRWERKRQGDRPDLAQLVRKPPARVGSTRLHRPAHAVAVG